MPLAKIETRYSTDPLITDDVTKGYGDPWFWENQATTAVFKCMDNTEGSAVWKEIGQTAALMDLINAKLNIADAPNYSVAQLSFYMDDTASGIAGYEVLSTTPDVSIEETDSAVCNNNTVQIARYVTDVLGITVLKAGSYNYHIWRSASSSSGTSKLEFKWYSRATNGTETLLYTHESNEINDTSLTYNETIIVEAVAKTILATDRLVLVISGKTDRITNTTISFSHSGTTRNSHVETPIDAPVSSALLAALELKRDKLDVETITAGEDLAANSIAYLKSDGKYWKTDSDVYATTAGRIAYIASAILANTTGVGLFNGVITTTGLTIGTPYYVSGTAGAYTSTEPTVGFSRQVMTAISTTQLKFEPCCLILGW